MAEIFFKVKPRNFTFCLIQYLFSKIEIERASVVCQTISSLIMMNMNFTIISNESCYAE